NDVINCILLNRSFCPSRVPEAPFVQLNASKHESFALWTVVRYGVSACVLVHAACAHAEILTSFLEVHNLFSLAIKATEHFFDLTEIVLKIHGLCLIKIELR